MTIKSFKSKINLRIFFRLTLATLALMATALAQQLTSPCDVPKSKINVHDINPGKLAQILNQPNGLERAANLAVHFSRDWDILPIQTADITSLVSESVVIGIGTVTARNSQLVLDGNDIETKYTVHINSLLKGSLPADGNVAIWEMGGCIAFPNGTTAEASTTLWRYLAVGKPYLLFLEKGETLDFSVISGMEGVGRVISPSGEFEIAADLDKRGHHVISDRPKGMTLTDLVNKIKVAQAVR